jgi:two-component system, OmpR family, copper resistance phosphate regulon response regulator CusR
MNILIVEDEPKVASVIKQTLNEYHHQVDIAPDGIEGKKKALTNEYDMIILDLVLPYLNGIEVCKAVRIENKKVPILMLSALGTTDDVVKGFDSGADDYLVKPFEFKELLARIKALERRTADPLDESRILKIANLELNLDRKNAKRDQVTIDLTAKEFTLLEYFMRNMGKVLSRNLIARKVWEIDFDTGTNIVDVYVNFLRKKIDKKYEPKLIHTMIGMGYFFGIKE